MYNLFLRNYGKKVRKVGKVRKSVKKLRVDCAVRLGWLQFITIDGYKFVNTGLVRNLFFVNYRLGRSHVLAHRNRAH